MKSNTWRSGKYFHKIGVTRIKFYNVVVLQYILSKLWQLLDVKLSRKVVWAFLLLIFSTPLPASVFSRGAPPLFCHLDQSENTGSQPCCLQAPDFCFKPEEICKIQHNADYRNAEFKVVYTDNMFVHLCTGFLEQKTQRLTDNNRGKILREPKLPKILRRGR